MSIFDKLPCCKKCGNSPILLGDPHSNRLMACSNSECENVEFDTCKEGAIWSWIVSNGKEAGEYLKLNLKWDRLKIDKKEETIEEDKLLTEMDKVWYSMTKEQIELVELAIKMMK